MRYWLELIGNSMLELMARALITIGKACVWLSYRLLVPSISRDVERMTLRGHLQQVIQDDLDGEPWDEDELEKFRSWLTDSGNWDDKDSFRTNFRTWRMQHDDEKDDR